MVRTGTAPATIAAKVSAIKALEEYLLSTRGAGGHNYSASSEQLPGDVVCDKKFWEGVAGCASYARL